MCLWPINSCSTLLCVCKRYAAAVSACPLQVWQGKTAVQSGVEEDYIIGCYGEAYNQVWYWTTLTATSNQNYDISGKFYWLSAVTSPVTPCHPKAGLRITELRMWHHALVSGQDCFVSACHFCNGRKLHNMLYVHTCSMQMAKAQYVAHAHTAVYMTIPACDCDELE